MTDKEPKTPSNRKAKKEANRYHLTIYPRSGDPYKVEVEVQEDKTLEYEGQSWIIAPGSVWMDNGRRCTGAAEGAAETISSNFLEGKTYLRARMFFLICKMKLLEQIFRLQDAKPWFKQSGVWIITGAIALLALILVWVASAISGGLEDVTDALMDGLRNIGTEGSPREEAGHSDIAPEG